MVDTKLKITIRTGRERREYTSSPTKTKSLVAVVFAISTVARLFIFPMTLDVPSFLLSEELVSVGSAATLICKLKSKRIWVKIDSNRAIVRVIVLT